MLDITAKVYVHYCAKPSPDVARTLAPMLHGALDNQIIKHLITRFPSAGTTSENLEDVDREKYGKLQSLPASRKKKCPSSTTKTFAWSRIQSPWWR